VLLRAIADLPDEALHRGLDGLQTAEFLYQTNLGPSDDYTFKHALTHEVAYGSLLHDRRRVLHARIVDAIEHVHAGRLMEQVDRLAYHAIRGEQWDQALGFLRQTATRALGRSAPREAALSLEQALEALGHLPETPERLEQGIDVRFDLQNALNPLGELERMLGHLRQAETIAERLGDQRRLGRVAAYMTVCLWWKGEMDASIVAGERALRIAITLNDLALEVLACYRLGQVYDVVGRHEAAIEVLSRPVRALQGTQARERFGLAVLPAAMCRSLLSICLASIGRFAEAVSAAEAAIQVAEDVDHQYSRVSPLRNLGYVYMIQGDLDRALPFLERAVSLCHEHGFEVLFPFAAAALGQAYVLAGRRSDAVTLLELARDRAAAMQFRGNEAYVRTILSEAYLASGRLAEAQASVQVGLELARCQHQRGIEANALRIAAEIRCALDPPDFDHAEADYREALGLTGETGMRPLEAHCHAGLSRLSRRVAKEQDAAEHFTIATTMYREMGMTYWLERVEGGDRLRGDRRA
jgi:tetratricopeptide (TPR) repeat protein